MILYLIAGDSVCKIQYHFLILFNLNNIIVRNFNKNAELVKHVTEFRETDINIGADVFISVEDAKGLLAMTDMTMSEDDRGMMLERARGFVRMIAKAVLYSGGNVTNQDELLTKFKLENLVSHRDIG